ncbi:MAG: 6-phosphogluconolactonase, partial [Arenicellales bacterium]|nr:6-phosphogluconolactonase [Arenicellales bacterium]
MSQPVFQNYAGPKEAAQAAALQLVASAREAISARGVFIMALSGGRSPHAMLTAFAKADLPWAQVRIFQVDERVAPAGDAARNWVMIEDALLQAGGPSQAEHYPMPVESDDLARAATAYAKTLALIAGDPVVIDLVHLGLGDDGHTASLVPGDEALMMTDRDVAVTALYRGHRRMTLTFPALNRARERLWLATGADKVTMLARLRDGDHRIPAGRVSGDNTIIFTDVRPDHETVSP